MEIPKELQDKASRFLIAQESCGIYFPPEQEKAVFEDKFDGEEVWIDGSPITIEQRGHPGEDIWAICKPHRCMRRTGTWSCESMPSSRSDAFKKATRFTLEEATKIAKKHGLIL